MASEILAFVSADIMEALMSSSRWKDLWWTVINEAFRDTFKDKLRTRAEMERASMVQHVVTGNVGKMHRNI